jgi:ribosomal-protein-alanine N-acetyltransferase
MAGQPFRSRKAGAEHLFMSLQQVDIESGKVAAEPARPHAGEPCCRAFPVLQTERLILRELAAADEAGVFNIYSKPEVTLVCDVVTLTDRRQAMNVLKVLQADWPKGTGIRWAVTLRGSPDVIGICGFAWYPHNRSALLSYDLNPEFWNQGIMTESVKTIVPHAFGCDGINRITATVVPENRASIQVLRKVGFRDEGVLREWGFWKGEFKDLRCFSLLRRDLVPG